MSPEQLRNEMRTRRANSLRMRLQETPDPAEQVEVIALFIESVEHAAAPTPQPESLSIYRCRKHGGIGFVSDCRECKCPAAPAPTEQPEPSKCVDCGTPLNDGEARTFTICTPCWEKLHARLAAPTEPVTPEGEREQATRYAKRLAESIYRSAYRETAPNWQPFDDLLGILTQIDNMVTGLASPADVARTRAEAMEEAAQVAEKQVENKRNPDSYREGWNDACWSVAAAIRAKANQGGAK